MVFSEASLSFPLQAVISFLCFFSVSVDVYVQETKWFISSKPLVYGYLSTAWLKIWKDISFKCRKGCECLPHVDTAARKINIQTYFLFMLIDTKLLYYLIYTFLHRENPGLLDCLLFCVVTISWIHWLCMISFLSESIILLFLPCFASSVFHVCW